MFEVALIVQRISLRSKVIILWLIPAVAPLVAELIMGNFLTSLPLLGVYSWVQGHMVAIELPKGSICYAFLFRCKVKGTIDACGCA